MLKLTKGFKPDYRTIAALKKALNCEKEVLFPYYRNFIAKHQGELYPCLNTAFRNFVVNRKPVITNEGFKDMSKLKEANQGVDVRDKLKLE